MAAPTAIPHPENSAHHADDSISTTNTVNSPPLVSPIYANAKAHAFSFPTAAASINPSGPPPSPHTSRFSSAWHRNTVHSAKSPSRPGPAPEYFEGHRPHSSSFSSSISSESEGPATPRSSLHQRTRSFSGTAQSPPPAESPLIHSTSGFTSGVGIGRRPSIPMSSSYEQAQKRMSTGSWSSPTGFALGMRNQSSRHGPEGRVSPPSLSPDTGGGGTGGGSGSSGMGNLLRKLSIGGAPLKGGVTQPPSSATVPVAAPTTSSPPRTASPPSSASLTMPESPSPVGPRAGTTVAPPLDASVRVAASAPATAPGSAPPATTKQARGRRSSVGGNGKRKPSPMGERLLMGHFDVHR